MKEKILILGISSFAGSSFANYLLNKKKYKIFGTFNNKNNFSFRQFLKNNKYLKSVKLYKKNLEKFKDLDKFVKKIEPHYIFDFASICMVNESWNSPKYYFDVNFNSKINMIKNLNKLKKLKKFIYISTPEIFGSTLNLVNENCHYFNPSTPYASSKLSMEILLNNYINDKNYKIIICRFSNFYGKGQSLYRLIPKLIYSINNKIKFYLHGGGISKRDFLHEDDFNDGLNRVITLGKISCKYHFSGSRHYTIKEIVKKITKIKKVSFGKVVKIVGDRKGKDKNYFLSCKLTKKKLGWKQKVNIDLGLREVINYYDSISAKIRINDTKFKIAIK